MPKIPETSAFFQFYLINGRAIVRTGLERLKSVIEQAICNFFKKFVVI
jgi:hypothetical protein